MFVRYLGGGIGHLEQLPTANENDNEHTATHDSGDTETEVNDFSMADTTGDDNNHEEDKDKEDKDEENGDEEGEEAEKG